MTDTERAIAAQKLAESFAKVAIQTLPHLDAHEQATIAMMAATATAVSFAAIRNMDARATLAEINVLAASMAEDVHGGRL